jgi:hypothetical protein
MSLLQRFRSLTQICVAWGGAALVCIAPAVAQPPYRQPGAGGGQRQFRQPGAGGGQRQFRQPGAGGGQRVLGPLSDPTARPPIRGPIQYPLQSSMPPEGEWAGPIPDPDGIPLEARPQDFSGLAIPARPLTQPDEEPRLVAAELLTHTNDDNKDHDTGIYATVETADGTALLAELNNADSSGDDATEYNDGSYHSIALPVTAWGMPKSLCRQFRVHLQQQTYGHDTWKFNARVILYFSDGTDLVADAFGIRLVNNGASTDFQAP